LSELVWRGVDRALVVDDEGRPRGQLTVASILAHGRPR